ncbi:TIGR01212 family radical SAM protein [Gloeobacter kilaueensis]|uniref:Coproporphyrinogen III oxidase n=1 Tax=Gloeobacter kilaueensis (strain ATCC BAA-2537 / CCAP 1431/1 / ULC 316 / JS1) TaxID=1183438 RepID=U5QPE4_GLOK1|nr:TIGR01212 family radical SAM protein [Gloeobacter kilaueensis]AGY59469.1 coproporphyrinogen III oxidase [Gloeobacter kilaueensis JS1]
MSESLPYNQFSRHLRERFGEKVFKVTLDAGFDCPNRDGTRARGGCTFCDASGSSAQVAPPTVPLLEQLQIGMAGWQRKFGERARKFVAYYQAFTNTHAPLSRLEEVYRIGLEHPDCVALAVGTRPDCVAEPVLELLQQMAHQKYLWVEYGLQSAHDATLQRINRAHSVAEFVDAVRRTRQRGIEVCAHLIHGLPGETPKMMLQSVDLLADLEVEGIKIHSLHILKGSIMAGQYLRGEIELMSEQQYVGSVCDSLERLPPQTWIHRLTGDGLPHLLIAPEWSRHKRAVLTAIEQEMRRRGTRQGSQYLLRSVAGR